MTSLLVWPHSLFDCRSCVGGKLSEVVLHHWNRSSRSRLLPCLTCLPRSWLVNQVACKGSRVWGKHVLKLHWDVKRELPLQEGSWRVSSRTERHSRYRIHALAWSILSAEGCGLIRWRRLVARLDIVTAAWRVTGCALGQMLLVLVQPLFL